MMWLMVMGVTLGGLAMVGFSFHEWRGARQIGLGMMSQRWLTEHHASNPS